MADTKISALSAVSASAGSDEYAVNQGGTSYKATLDQAGAYLLGGGYDPDLEWDATER